MYTLAGFDITIHSSVSSVAGTDDATRPRRQDFLEDFT
jgi:hypothetical protein